MSKNSIEFKSSRLESKKKPGPSSPVPPTAKTWQLLDLVTSICATLYTYSKANYLPTG